MGTETVELYRRERGCPSDAPLSLPQASLSLDPSSPLSPRPLVVACLSDLRFLSFTLSRVSDMSDTRGGALAQRLLEAEAALAAFAENTERRRKPDAAYVFLLRLPYAASGRPPSPSAEHWRMIQPPPERREETEVRGTQGTKGLIKVFLSSEALRGAALSLESLARPIGLVEGARDVGL